MARQIAEWTGGDLFEIKTSQFYPQEHDPCSLQAHEEQLADFRPLLTTRVEHMEDYQRVFIGHPIWWYREPMVIRSFYRAYDFSGKQIIPFATSGEVGLANTMKDLQQYLPSSILEEGLRLSSVQGKDNQQRLQSWLEKIERRKPK